MAKKQNTRRKDGLIQVQVFIGRDETGKRIYQTVYGHTQKEAEAKADEIRLLRKKGIDLSAQNDTVGEWADTWLRIKSSERISKGRITVYGCNIKHIKKFFTDIPLTKVRSVDMQNMLISLASNNPNTKKPMSEKTMKSIKSTLIQIYELAIENRVLEYNPARNIKIPSSPNHREVRALTEDEQAWIINSPHRAQRAAMIMMYSGLRRGELVPLTWNDIDFENKTITVNKAVEVENGKFVLKTLAKSKELVKTEASYRTIDIPNRLIEFLKGEKRESIYVCVTTKVKMHTTSSWSRMWESYLSDLNIKYGDFSPFEKEYKSKFDPDGVPFVIPRINPHWLRHTFCTLLYYAGYDLKSAMEQMGHADIKTTLAIYTHLDKKHKREQVRKLDEYLTPDASNVQVSDSSN